MQPNIDAASNDNKPTLYFRVKLSSLFRSSNTDPVLTPPNRTHQCQKQTCDDVFHCVVPVGSRTLTLPNFKDSWWAKGHEDKKHVSFN
jgi:hypothetical protein